MSKDLLARHLVEDFCFYRKEAIRLTRRQNAITTRKLVDNIREHEVLAQILAKPHAAFVRANSRGVLHPLLSNPFRSPPLAYGGRFHTRFEQSLFYGANDIKTAMAEVAYHRFLDQKLSAAQLEPMQVPYISFTVKLVSQKALELVESPFDRWQARISHPSTYTHSQSFGAKMRQCGVEVFSFASARQKKGVCVGVLSAEAFAQNTPIAGKSLHW